MKMAPQNCDTGKHWHSLLFPIPIHAFQIPNQFHHSRCISGLDIEMEIGRIFLFYIILVQCLLSHSYDICPGTFSIYFFIPYVRGIWCSLQVHCATDVHACEWLQLGCNSLIPFLLISSFLRVNRHIHLAFKWRFQCHSFLQGFYFLLSIILPKYAIQLI